MIDNVINKIKDLLPKVSSLPWNRDDDDKDDCGIHSVKGGCVLSIQPHGNINTINKTGESFSNNDMEFVLTVCNNIELIIKEIEVLRIEKNDLIKNFKQVNEKVDKIIKEFSKISKGE